ncbi:MAG TPA: hypothetical protein VK539_14695 [Myxococcaceae bacterium]|nr:hypothetical protein [Myxococcaceae bacterium]
MMQPQEVRLLQQPPPPPTPALWEMTLEELRDAILQCLLQGPAGHYRIGRLYNHIVLCRRAVNEGYPTTREYFRQHVRVLSYRSLVMFGAVARKFRREFCEKYGMVQLGLLLEHERLRYGHYPYFPGDPGAVPVELPRRAGLTLTKPFADCTLEDLRQWVRARRAHQHFPEPAGPLA